MRDRLILHYSAHGWRQVDGLRWTWCGMFVPLERVTDRWEVVTCGRCRRYLQLGPRAVH